MEKKLSQQAFDEQVVQGQKYICFSPCGVVLKSKQNNLPAMKLDLNPSTEEFTVVSVGPDLIQLKPKDSKITESIVLVTRKQLENNFSLALSKK